MDRVYLHVPPEDYTEAERAGASWDDRSKRWYVTHEAISRVARWVEEDSAGLFNISSDEAFIASAKVSCFRCGLETEVICIFGDKGRDIDIDQDIESFTVSSVSAVDAGLRAELGRWSTYDDTSDGVFTNHCSRCGSIQEDYRLHSEPGDVFFAISRTDSKHVEFIPLVGSVQIQGDYSLSL